MAGGKGTRLGEISKDLPKPMIDINGKPLLEHIINECFKYKFKDIKILVEHKAEVIQSYFGDGKKNNVSIEYFIEKEPRGTAGALIDIIKKLEKDFIIIYADTFINVDLTKFYNFHKKQKSELSIFVHPNNHPHDSDIIELDDFNNVKKLYSYPHDGIKPLNNLVNGALYVSNKNIFENINLKLRKIDIAKDIIPYLIKKKFILKGYRSSEYIKDLGTPERLGQIKEDFKFNKIKNLSISLPKKTIFLDRDGVINEEIGYISDPSQIKILPNVSLAIKEANKRGILVIVITNQPVVARGECTFHKLKLIHNHIETLLGADGAYLDGIYFCPHHPDKGFKDEVKSLKVVCKCRKPGTKLLSIATKEFNIDLNKSWMIGDSTTDIQTAKNIGIRSILLETGYSGSDKKFDALPDFKSIDLLNAIKHIIDN